jgi:type III restriction enzyme
MQNPGQFSAQNNTRANLWDTPDAREDRWLGGLWAEMSGNSCRFVMVKEQDWPAIEAKL